MKSELYWASRARLNEQLSQKSADEQVLEITRAYDSTLNYIEQEIKKIYRTFGDNGSLSNEVMDELLTNKESFELLEDLKKQIVTIEDPAIKRLLLKRINAPAYAHRISRLKALKEQVYIRCKTLADKQTALTETALRRVTDESYCRTMYDIQQRAGVGKIVTTDHLFEQIFNSEWYGKSFSDIVWKNTDILAEKLYDVIRSGLMSGKSISQMAKELEDLSSIGKYAASRVVRTEISYMLNQAQLKATADAGIEKYRYLAALDIRTCDKCGKLDNKIFLVSEAKAGVNMPPIHPNDRCTIVSYCDDWGIVGERFARDADGKAIKVPATMTYKEWKKEFLKSS